MKIRFLLMRTYSLLLVVCTAIFMQVSPLCMTSLASKPVNGTSTRLFRNVVKITSSFTSGSSEAGFGFIMYESNDSIYVATAQHVVFRSEQDALKSIVITFFNQSRETDVVVRNTDKGLDLALLGIQKTEDYKWEFRKSICTIDKGSNVWVIGRDLIWDNTGQDLPGEVLRKSDEIIEFSCPAVRRGTSGGPLISDCGIIGMVIEDAGDTATAIDIHAIQKKAYQWLDIDRLNIKDFPIVAVGVHTGTAYIHDGNKALSEPNVQKSFQPHYGIFIEPIFHSHFTIRFEIAEYRTGTKTFMFDDRSFQFKNRYLSYTASLKYYFSPTTVENHLVNIYLGYSLIRMNPEISINAEPWQSLRDWQEAAHTYSDNAHAIAFGFEGYFYNSSFLFSVGGEIGYSFSKYLSLDTWDPYYSNNKNDWFISVRLSFGYVFRRSESRMKVLR